MATVDDDFVGGPEDHKNGKNTKRKRKAETNIVREISRELFIGNIMVLIGERLF